MVDSDDSLSHLRPTRQNLIRKLKHLTKNAKAGDKFFFFCKFLWITNIGRIDAERKRRRWTWRTTSLSQWIRV